MYCNYFLLENFSTHNVAVAGIIPENCLNKLNRHIWLDSPMLGQINYTGYFENTDKIYCAYLNNNLEELVKITGGKVIEEKPITFKLRDELEDSIKRLEI